MATIKSIIQKRKGTAGNWQVNQVTRTDDYVVCCQLWHYGTMMLEWRELNPRDEDYLDYALGWGSVSDQNGMNIAFRELNLPLYYSRRGGSEILPLGAKV